MDEQDRERIEEIKQRGTASPLDVQFLLNVIEDLDSQLDVAFQILEDEEVI